jgi:DNA-binding IclR family transcriptional regulator
VLEFVRGHPGASIIQIHRALDLNYYRVGMHLEQLEILGFMRSKPHRFLLPWWRSERSQKLHAHHYVLSEIRPRDPETAYLVHLIHSTREWVFPEDTT